MVENPLGLMRSLQHSDSFFPSGATAFSWGLESLNRDQIIGDAKSLAQYVETQLLHRWVSFDQGIIAAAWQVSNSLNDYSGADLSQLIAIDDFADAMTLSESTRVGSRKLGQTLTTVHVKLETKSAIQLQLYLRAHTGIQSLHLAVAQGYLWAALGVSEIEARAISAHTLCTSTTSAALRLGLIGHIDAQRIMMQLQPLIVEALNTTAPSLAALASSTLAADIANLRHASLDARMFVN